jgi:hypothetical protein
VHLHHDSPPSRISSARNTRLIPAADELALDPERRS